jgi:hypothetical protein
VSELEVTIRLGNIEKINDTIKSLQDISGGKPITGVGIVHLTDTIGILKAIRQKAKAVEGEG